MKKFKRFFLIFITCTMITGCNLVSNKDANHIFTYAMTEGWQTLDSTLAHDSASYALIHTFMEGLYEYGRNSEGKLKPVKCFLKSLHALDDKKTYKIVLKKNIKWSNGENITAKDFVYAWKRALTLHSKDAIYMTSEGIHIKGADEIYNKGADANILGVSAKNNQTLIVEMTNKIEKNILVDYFILPVFYPLNQKYVESQGDAYGTSSSHILTNGPFKITSLSKDKAELVKWDGYYENHKVHLNKIKILFNEKNDNIVKKFDKAQIDLGTTYGSKLQKYKRKATFTNMPSGIEWMLLPNFKSKSMQYRNMRKAISFAINSNDLEKNKMCTALLDGNDNVFDKPKGLVPNNIEYNSLSMNIRDISTAEKKYSKKSAKKIINRYYKDNGINNLKLTIAYPAEYDISTLISANLKEYLEAINGVKVNLVKYREEDKEQYDLTLIRRQARANNGILFVDMLASSGNLSNYNNTEYDNIITNIKKADSYDERFNLIIDAEVKAVNEDYAAIPVAQQSYAILSRMDANNLDFIPFGVPINFKHVTLN